MEGDHLDGLAEPHVVGQAAAEPELAHRQQPCNPATLIRAKLGGQPGGRLEVEGSPGQPLQAFGEPCEGAPHLDRNDLPVDRQPSGEGSRQHLGRPEGPSSPLAQLLDKGRVSRHETPPHPHDAPLRLGELVHLLLGQGRPSESHLPLELQQGVEREAGSGGSRRGRRDGTQLWRIVEQLARPEDAHARPFEGVSGVAEQVAELVRAERQRVGHLCP